MLNHWHTLGDNIEKSGEDYDDPIPVEFVTYVHRHIAILAPFFLKRRQKMVAQSSDHLAPHVYLQKVFMLNIRYVFYSCTI